LHLLFEPAQAGAGRECPIQKTRTEGVVTESSVGPSATPPGAGFAASHQGPPASGGDLDPELAGGRPDAPPHRVALSIRDALDLVESRHRVAHVTRVVQRFLPLGGETRTWTPASGSPGGRWGPARASVFVSRAPAGSAPGELFWCCVGRQTSGVGSPFCVPP